MQQYRKNLGKVSLTAEGPWNGSKRYEILSIVYDEHTQHGFISKKEVPSGVDLYNAEYWMPLNVSGFVDNNIIILSKKTSDASIQSYTLEEAVKSIPSVGRKPGAILGFYNLNTDRLDIGGRWELWQYNAVDVANWENLSSWQNIYYNFNRFVGWYRNEDMLKANIPYPELGCYAYVGNQLERATIYRCDIKYNWVNTSQPVWDYIQVVVSGNVKVGPNGNWFNNGEDTGVPAVGPAGKTPQFRMSDTHIEISFDGVAWDNLVPLDDITPTIAVGQVNTLDSGKFATVENTGTPRKAVFNFGIPRGVQGAPGQKGDGWDIKGWVDSVAQLPSTGNIGDTYMVGTSTPYAVYMYKNNTSKFVNIGTANEIKASVFDGGRADTLYGGAREINCGGADAYLT